MAKGKDTFIFREKWFDEKFKELNDHEVVTILKAVIETHKTGEIVEIEGDRLMRVAYHEIVTDIQETDSKYEETCSKRAEAGRRGGLAKAANDRLREEADPEEDDEAEEPEELEATEEVNEEAFTFR